MSYDPELYALVHTGTPGDVAFYLGLAERGTRVLELGCGTGRVLLALAAHGAIVTGIERDAATLHALRRQCERAPPEVRARVSCVEGDMATFDLGTRFDRVFVPFSGLYCLATPERLRACLARARAHLEPGGSLAFDGYAADEFHASSRPEDYPRDRLEPVCDVVHRGESLRVYERSAWDRDAQRIDATYVYVGADGTVRHEATLEHRYLLSGQIAPLLAGAGFGPPRIQGDFAGGRFDPARGSLVVTARAV